MGNALFMFLFTRCCGVKRVGVNKANGFMEFIIFTFVKCWNK